MSGIVETPAIIRASNARVGSPGGVRVAFVLILAIAFAAGSLATPSGTTDAIAQHAGPALARLLRAMAAIKMLLAACATAAIFWRLGAAVTLSWFGAYALAAAAMWAGPGVIWGLAHVGLGALLLHGGLLASILLLWRDPAMAQKLAATIAQRSALLAARR